MLLTELHYEIRTVQQILLPIHVVMGSVTGAVAKGVSVSMCVAPLATFYRGRNIVHNESLSAHKAIVNE